jgi:hypothetical protein
MIHRTLCITLAALALGACGGNSADTAATDAAADMTDYVPPALSMPADSVVERIIPAMYSLMSTQWIVGDSTLFAEMYLADSTDLWVSGVGAHWDRAQVAAGFAALGRSLGAKSLERSSAGITINEREVSDSGTYTVVLPAGAAAPRFGRSGRYWTTWTYTPNGEWRIIRDELLADGRAERERAARPTRPAR